MKKLLTIALILLLASCTKIEMDQPINQDDKIYDTIPVIIPIDSTRL